MRLEEIIHANYPREMPDTIQGEIPDGVKLDRFPGAPYPHFVAPEGIFFGKKRVPGADTEFVFVDGDRIVGTLLAGFMEIEPGHEVMSIYHIHLNPEYQGKKIAYATYKAMANAGIDILSSFGHSTGSKKNYERMAADPDVQVWVVRLGQYWPREAGTGMEVVKRYEPEKDRVYGELDLGLLITGGRK